jgi:hypothetical protein
MGSTGRFLAICRRGDARMKDKRNVAMWYEIWDCETRNIITWHDTEDAALAVVAATIAQHGRDAVATWMLVQEDGTESERDAIIAEGNALADLAIHAPVHGDD